MGIDAIEKVLSANDTGETGGHQAGILVPKSVLSFFPSLSSATKNPREILEFLDPTGRTWTFAFIYYNNRFFGGTRNEFRLTGMTEFIRTYNLKEGDTVILQRGGGRELHIRYRRVGATSTKIKLSAGWKIIEIE